ncbi:MAG: chloride channel protein [Lachnospiraceae bacterium]|nr:chloride channel protein [Lachnospiraceae bacterium]
MKDKLDYYFTRLGAFMRWSAFGILTGLVAGGFASIFALALGWATGYRTAHPQILYGLPLAGLAISGLYYHLGKKGDQGTNLVIESVRKKEDVPWYVAIRIFVSTFLTHLFGGSAGREGAALQMGGSISSTIAQVLYTWKLDQTTVIMTGMAASFSALFGTPLAATVFAMEMVNVGEIYYSALVPCSFAAVVGMMTARLMGVEPEGFDLPFVPELSPYNLIMVILLAALCAVVSVSFCVAMKKSHKFFHEPFWNHYAAVFTAGCILVILNLIVHSTDYMGAGMNVISNAIRGNVRPEAFLLKIIFTAITLGSCYKGGEIVPSFYIGATFGCLFGQIAGFSPSICAALGMVSVFCGVTNCPISSILIAAELFGFEGIYYFLICISVSYMLSGYYSLYSSQKIVYNKYTVHSEQEFK